MPLLETTITGILLDIEGTTTHMDFVCDVLFPYARVHVHAFLVEHLSDEGVRADRASLRELQAADERQGLRAPVLRDDSGEEQLASIVSYVHCCGSGSKVDSVEINPGKSLGARLPYRRTAQLAFPGCAHSA